MMPPEQSPVESTRRGIPGDWYPGSIPANAVIDEEALIETTMSFLFYRSQCAVGLRLGRGSSTHGVTMFDVGTDGQVSVGEFALLNNARIVCDAAVEIGACTLISWNVLIMDTYRVPIDAAGRRRELRSVAHRAERRVDAGVPAKPIRIGANVWIGFDSCVLPGVAIGEGSVVGARSVVGSDVDPYTVVAGNPARVIRRLEPGAVQT
jgi:acetyltransferase-like isoleucine patch superfamily enzyme